MNKLTDKGFRRIMGAYILASILLLLGIGIAQLSLPKLGPGYTLAMIFFVLVCFYWVLMLIVSRKGSGLRAYVQRLYTAEKTSQALEDPEYRSKLVERLNAMRDTCATFASITIAVVAIAAALFVNPKSIELPILVIVGGAAVSLVIGAVVLIHAVDACDTAMNPQLDCSTLENVRYLAMNYYAVGLFCLIGALLLCIAIVNPYLTPATSVVYMCVAWNYFFFWQRH